MTDELISYSALSDERYRTINEALEKKDTIDVIKWAYSTFEEELIYFCSFGAEGMVLIDLISRVRKDAIVIFLDTHVHFKETYELIDRVKARYPKMRIRLIEPDITLKSQAEVYGDQLWLTNPNLCCQLRKVEPLTRALEGATAWMSGLRKDQSPTRSHVQYMNKDDKFNSIKICPLIHWTWDDIWLYIRNYNLTYNELHDRGFPSIGCEPCTQAIAGNGDSRAGRWSGSGKTECGLHST